LYFVRESQNPRLKLVVWIKLVVLGLVGADVDPADEGRDPRFRQDGLDLPLCFVDVFRRQFSDRNTVLGVNEG
jgi:hypothetical protein